MPINLLLAFALAVQATPTAPTYTVETCSDPVARKAMLAGGPDKFPLFKALADQSEANKARMTVVLDRLTERGKLTPDQRRGVVMKMLEDARFKSALAEAGPLLEAAMDSMVKMTGKDEAKDCRTVMEMAASVPRFEANAAKQWEAMRLVLESEASKRGISLGD